MSEQEFIEQINSNYGTIHRACNAYCRTYSRNDLVQDIILETWKSLSNWKSSCKFNTWLFAVARNVCIDKLRKLEKQPEVVELWEYENTLAEVDNTPELIKQLQDAKRYNTVLDSIEEPYQALFHSYVYGASFADLEKQSGISANSLRVKFHRIKKQLQLRYGKEII